MLSPQPRLSMLVQVAAEAPKPSNIDPSAGHSGHVLGVVMLAMLV